MEIKDIQRSELRDVVTTIRTYPSYARWMEENHISPSKLFNAALEELMGKEQNGE